MLHLETGVDLDKVVFPMFVHQKLHCARIFIANLNSKMCNVALDTGGGYMPAEIEVDTVVCMALTLVILNTSLSLFNG